MFIRGKSIETDKRLMVARVKALGRRAREWEVAANVYGVSLGMIKIFWN